MAHRLAVLWLRGRSRVGENFKGLQPVLPFVPWSSVFGVYEEFGVCTDNLEGSIEDCFEARASKIATRDHKIPTKKDIKKWKLNQD